MSRVDIGGAAIELDADGHLLDPGLWTPALAEALAAADGVELGVEQWWLIELVRRHHQHYGTPPLMRSVIAALRQQRQDAALGSRAVYRIFSDNPVRQACRYGGLPKPDWCI